MLGFDIRWSEIPMIIKLGLLLWLGAILSFAYMVFSAIFPSWGSSTTTLLRIAYIGGTMFVVGVVMVIIGLPKTQNHHPSVKHRNSKSK